MMVSHGCISRIHLTMHEPNSRCVSAEPWNRRPRVYHCSLWPAFSRLHGHSTRLGWITVLFNDAGCQIGYFRGEKRRGVKMVTTIAQVDGIQWPPFPGPHGLICHLASQSPRTQNKSAFLAGEVTDAWKGKVCAGWDWIFYFEKKNLNSTFCFDLILHSQLQHCITAAQLTWRRLVLDSQFGPLQIPISLCGYRAFISKITAPVIEQLAHKQVKYKE